MENIDEAIDLHRVPVNSMLIMGNTEFNEIGGCHCEIHFSPSQQQQLTADTQK